MKSIRHEILGHLTSGPKLVDDLMTLMDEPRKRLQDNIAGAIADKLIVRARDDVTGMPIYSLTQAGRERLKAGVGSGGGKPYKTTIKTAPTSQPARSCPTAKCNDDEDDASSDEPAMPPADAGLLASANRMLSGRLVYFLMMRRPPNSTQESTLSEIRDLKKLLGESQDMLHAICKELDVSTHVEIIPAIQLLHSIENRYRDDPIVQLRPIEPNHPLQSVFSAVIDQVTSGKGVRHGGGTTPFESQPWRAIADTVGSAFLIGQGVKKAMESSSKPDQVSKETELLGAIAYLAMAVYHEDLRQKKHRETA